MIGQVWGICLFLELGEWVGSNSIQNGRQAVPQRKIRVLLPEEERKGVAKAKNDTRPSHAPCSFILLLAFEIYEKKWTILQ